MCEIVGRVYLRTFIQIVARLSTYTRAHTRVIVSSLAIHSLLSRPSLLFFFLYSFSLFFFSPFSVLTLLTIYICMYINCNVRSSAQIFTQKCVLYLYARVDMRTDSQMRDQEIVSLVTDLLHNVCVCTSILYICVSVYI